MQNLWLKTPILRKFRGNIIDYNFGRIFYDGKLQLSTPPTFLSHKAVSNSDAD